MTNTLTLPLILQMIGTTIMIIGVLFGLQNIRQFHAGRKREAAILMLSSFQTTDFVRGLLSVFELPDRAGKSDMERLPPEQFVAIYMVMGTWERLGILVYRREIEFGLVQDAFSGAILLSWQKLERYVTDLRVQWGRDTAMEWFQWLAERMMDREAATSPLPAYQAHRDWHATP